MPPVLTLQGISKNYGSIRALNLVSFEVPEGSVFGILGPNGSGKTTLLSIVMDILVPTSGSFRLFGEWPTEIQRRRIGTLLETPNFYHYLSGKDNLVIASRIKEKGFGDIDKVLEIVGLTQRRNSRFNTYSLGMKQRLAIAASLIGDPSVLVLDEPTNGLDPVGIAEIRELIRQLAQEGKTIIMASHLLDEVEKVCTHVAILKTGELLADGPVDEVLVNEDLLDIGAADLGKLKEVMQDYPGLGSLKESGNLLTAGFTSGISPGEVNQYCFSRGVVLTQLRIRKRSLESKFIELISSPKTR